MSRFVKNTNAVPVSKHQFTDGNERTDGKRWNHVRTKRFSGMLVDVSAVPSPDGLRRCERAKGAEPVSPVQRAKIERETPEKALTREQRLEQMLIAAFRKDR